MEQTPGQYAQILADLCRPITTQFSITRSGHHDQRDGDFSGG